MIREQPRFVKIPGFRLKEQRIVQDLGQIAEFIGVDTLLSVIISTRFFTEGVDAIVGDILGILSEVIDANIDDDVSEYDMLLEANRLLGKNHEDVLYATVLDIMAFYEAGVMGTCLRRTPEDRTYRDYDYVRHVGNIFEVEEG